MLTVRYRREFANGNVLDNEARLNSRDIGNLIHWCRLFPEIVGWSLSWNGTVMIQGGTYAKPTPNRRR